jgi:hypothetical protein
MTAMPTAYSYIRFSSARQKRGDSEKRQEASPEPWCAAHGYTLDPAHPRFHPLMAISVRSMSTGIPIPGEPPPEEDPRFDPLLQSLTVPEYPSLLSQAATLAASTARHVAAGMPMVTAHEKETRLAICHACPSYDAGRCRSCGCVLEIKCGWALESCPLDPPKWGPIETQAKGRCGGCGG